MISRPTKPRRNRRRLSALLVGVAILAASSSASAQPTRRDTPLRTPKPGAAKPKAPTPGGAAGGTPRTGAGATAPGGAGGTGTGPGAGTGPIGIAPDIEFKGPPPGGQVNFNMRDADLPDLVEAVTAITGRRFIFGGKVRQIKATIISPKNVSAGEAYAAFLSVLETNGLTVVPHGRYLKIVETAGAQSQETPILGTAEPVPYVDQYVTRLYRLQHVDATEVSTVLSKFKSKDADITVYAPSNLLIITDTGANIRRLLRIVEELDAGGAGEQLYMQPIHHTEATDVAAALNEMLDVGTGGRAKIIAEDRNNMLVVVATEGDYQRVLELIKVIDTPKAGEGTLHVMPLQHARCDELSATLGQIVGGGTGAVRRPNTPAGRTGTRTPTASGGAASGTGESEIFEGNVKINCDEATNALVAVSSLRDYAQLRNVIDKLDQPRRQVFIEAVIMDVNVDHTNETGIGFHGGATANLGGGGDTIFYGGSNAQQSLLGVPASLEALAFGVRGPDLEGSSQLLGTGVSIPAFGIVLHALARSGDSNVLATPHILATDNITAEISIGQNIPLQTNVGGGANLGQLAGLAGGQAGGAAGGLGGLAGLAGGLGFGFQAPRQDVGIRLSITPHINDSNMVRMEIEEEFSDAGSPTGALGAVPINKRTANTTIIVKDQQTVVIGGLVREGQVNGETKIPILGDLPVLGILFKQTQKQTQKTNLLLILTPHIIRDQNDLRFIFERKMQERQEFLDRYFVFEDSLPWEPAKDYSRTNGLLEHIRQTQLAMEERERIASELAPVEGRTHEQVKPMQLPSMAGPKATGGAGGKPAATPAPPRRNTRRNTRGSTGGTTNRPQMRVPGALLRNQKRYRVE